MDGPSIVDETGALARVLELCDHRAGDDAAALLVGAGGVCVSTDATVAGVHAPAACPPRALGRHAAGRAASDLSAMGAAPLAMTCAVQVPEGSDGWQQAVELVEGIATRGRLQGLPLVGGDLCRTPGPLAAVVTVLGRRGAPRTRGFVSRAGARAGDVIVVTGQLGAVAAALGRGDTVLPEPPDRLRAGQVLARHARAMVDVSDGLERDARHVAMASGVQLHVQLDAVPVVDGVDPMVAASFGDDYELLACVPPGRVDALRSMLAAIDPKESLTVVGVVVDGDPTARFLRDGRELQLPRGFVHE